MSFDHHPVTGVVTRLKIAVEFAAAVISAALLGGCVLLVWSPMRGVGLMLLGMLCGPLGLYWNYGWAREYPIHYCVVPTLVSMAPVVWMGAVRRRSRILLAIAAFIWTWSTGYFVAMEGG